MKMKNMVTDRHCELTSDKFNLHLNNAFSPKRKHNTKNSDNTNRYLEL